MPFLLPLIILLSSLFTVSVQVAAASMDEDIEAADVVLISNHPLALLVASLLGSDDIPAIRELLPPGGSVHHPTLRPSDRAALEWATVAVWFGPELEPGLAPYMTLVSPRPVIDAGGFLSREDFSARGQGRDKRLDPHVWLAPELVVTMVQGLATELLALELVDERALEQSARFQRRLLALTESYRQRIAALEHTQFIAAHDAFDYLARYLQLEQMGFLLDVNELPVGMKSLWRLQRALPEGMDICVLGSPRDSSDSLRHLDALTAYHVGLVDVLATTTPTSAEGFLDFMAESLEAIYQCLASNRMP